MAADPYNISGGYLDTLQGGGTPIYTQPTTNFSSTGSFNGEYGGGFDWGSNITQWLKLAPNIIASSKGNPYASGQYGQGSYPTAGGALS